jgi:hypothetical protein
MSCKVTEAICILASSKYRISRTGSHTGGRDGAGVSGINYPRFAEGGGVMKREKLRDLLLSVGAFVLLIINIHSMVSWRGVVQMVMAWCTNGHVYNYRI